MTLNESIQGLAPSAVITLFELDATALGDSVYHFTSMVNGSSPIVFNGITYTPIDIEATGFEWVGKGSLPTPTLRLSNVTNTMTSAVIAYNDLLGAKITRIRTLAEFLDGMAGADPTATFPVDIFYVEQKTLMNKNEIEFKLAASVDVEGKKLPARQVLRDACTWVYRYYNTVTGLFEYDALTPCPYSGSSYFTKANQPTTNPSLDRCSKTLDGCRARYGQNGELPFSGFPGVGRTS
ncbi:MAG: phage minor tail protein L [Caulobacteraceae bacterium]|nr:phage minor tail protein L [Caulobacteraceae bacterium]